MDLIRARQNKLPADKSTFIEFEVLGVWAWDVDSNTFPDTHWITYEEMAEQLGVEKARSAAEIFIVELGDAVTDLTHELEDALAAVDEETEPETTTA